MKPGNRIPIVAATLVVLAVVAGTFILRGRDHARVDDAMAVGGTSPAAVAPAAPPDAHASARAPAGGTPPAAAMVDQVERRAQLREAHEARTRELREQSERRYASEQVDPSWAPGKESELTGLASQEAFDVAGAKPSSLDIDCRSSMCRINGQFESSTQAEDWILMYMSSVGSRMPNSVVSRRRNPDGSMSVEIYGRGR